MKKTYENQHAPKHLKHLIPVWNVALPDSPNIKSCHRTVRLYSSIFYLSLRGCKAIQPNCLTSLWRVGKLSFHWLYQTAWAFGRLCRKFSPVHHVHFLHSCILHIISYIIKLSFIHIYPVFTPCFNLCQKIIPLNVVMANSRSTCFCLRPLSQGWLSIGSFRPSRKQHTDLLVFLSKSKTGAQAESPLCSWIATHWTTSIEQ